MSNDERVQRIVLDRRNLERLADALTAPVDGDLTLPLLAQAGWNAALTALRNVAVEMPDIDAEQAELREQLALYKRGGKTLGETIEKQCQMVLDATGLHDWIDEDGDGDWGAVWENLLELRPRLERTERALADERAEVERLRELVHVGAELDNHHNAARCPYCAPDPAEAKVARVKALADDWERRGDGSQVTSIRPWWAANAVRAALAGPEPETIENGESAWPSG